MNDMNVIRKTSSGIQSLSLDAVLLDKRMIFLSGVITSASVDLIVKQLLFLEGLDERERVKLIINSSGGEVEAGLFLYQQIKGMDVPIDLYCTELAASMAGILLAGGKHGRYSVFTALFPADIPRIHRDSAVRYDCCVMPSLLFVPVHDKHIVCKVFSESKIFLIRFFL